MNNLLQLKGEFQQRSRTPNFGPPKLPTGKEVHIEHLNKLHKNLVDLVDFWKNKNIISGALVSIYYDDIIAKSNRVKGFFSTPSKTPDSSIVGARFTEDGTKHIITHYLDKDIIANTIKKIEIAIEVVDNEFNKVCTEDSIESAGKNSDFQKKINKYDISKKDFLNMVVDASHIEKIAVYENSDIITTDSIVTLYTTNLTAKEIMQKIGVDLLNAKVIDETTLVLNADEFSILNEKAPYLISMSVNDISELSLEKIISGKDEKFEIPDPKDEPTIGVIDTMFDKSVYFSKWVEFTKMISDDIPLSSEDYNHGTAVSSIIVDGPAFNPHMDDGCGRFKVRHFGVALKKQFSSSSIMRSINEIIKKNRDIKVWNLSLGSTHPINKNFISPEAAILDKIQYENDVIFVIAGTNDNNNTLTKKIGAPADSLNSVVVNSVSFKDNKPAPYSRNGVVLSFFNKPDVSYYGGDGKANIRVCEPLGEAFVAGTSFAAPWISRKIAYLINILGFTREVAKALIIDSATNWNPLMDKQQAALVGFGVVPIRIEDVLNVPSDEIKFTISGISEKYDTYNYNLPLPVADSKHPFIAKATLCYFPKSSRNQGVDYTDTELDIYFGRIDGTKILSINKNTQSLDDEHHNFERTARKFWRKWDNTKHITEIYTKGIRPKKAYHNNLWGISIKTKERLEKRDEKGLKFGIVVRFKEINGVNRIDEFIKLCSLRGWLVNKIDIVNKVEIYKKLNEKIDFE